MSPPSRRRGLKLEYLQYLLKHSQSPPSRRRGLKFTTKQVRFSCNNCRLLRGGVDWNVRYKWNKIWVLVASFAEAWIEINITPYAPAFLKVASFAEAWIEIANNFNMLYVLSSRLLRGGVDWNYAMNTSLLNGFNVASFAEAWIEMKVMSEYDSEITCRLLRGGVDWNFWLSRFTIKSPFVASFAEAWIEIPKKIT